MSEKIIIICTECKNATDSWEVTHDQDDNLVYGVCLHCIERNMSPTDFEELLEFRAMIPGVDRW